ncbi:GntR family transcriptional regulator [Devosia rhodophyticola]|uniref:GntR family transcriptional regulator n=1 Tax=Devosia rhodophyticola TaxID=3026423 RepID=A0ABY7Z1X8_9HYPH|nr:GntR family transcriptional regulator [Devosia rhodophyticola]WDR07288.1 GntR family transcriptional regulator [Devosia rhodophyticola]
MSRSSSAMIVRYLSDAELGSGAKLPAEIDMAKELGLSRNSIREAYATLTAQGVLIRKHGIGTFVARPPIMNNLINGPTFWGMVQMTGADPSLRELVRDRVAANEELATQMDIPPKTEVVHLRWLFCANDQPVVLIDHYLAPHIRSDNIDWQASHNLLAALADQIGGEGAELETWNTAINATEEEATILNVALGKAILYGSVRVHDARGRIPIVSRHWSNPKLFSIAHRLPISAMQLSV